MDDKKLAEFLITHGADVNAADASQVTALHKAVFAGHADIVRLLLRHGANPDAVSIFGNTPVELAESEGKVRILSIFGINEDTKKASALFKEGVEHFRMHQSDSARQSWEQALKAFQTTKGTEMKQAECHANIALVLHDMGQYEAAIARQKQALRFFQTTKGTELKQATCYVNIGAVLWSMGQHEAAITRQEQALNIFQMFQGREWEQARCYMNIGVLLGDMGQHEADIDHQKRAIKFFLTARTQALSANPSLVETIKGNWQERANTVENMEWERAGCYVNIGGALIRMGKYEEGIARFEQALDLYDSALDLARKTPDDNVRLKMRCFVNIGGTLIRMGKYLEGIARLVKILKFLDANKDVRGCEGILPTCLCNIGYGFLGLGQYPKALEVFNLAGDHDWWTLRGRALAYRGRHGHVRDDAQEAIRSVLAVKCLLSACSDAEKRRTNLWATENRAGMFEESSIVFRDIVELLVDLQHDSIPFVVPELSVWSRDQRQPLGGLEAAFHFSDRGKSRSLDDALRERSILKAARADTRLLAEDKELSQRISKLTTMREQLPDAQVERKKKLTQDIEELQQRRNMIEVELKRTALGRYVAPEFRKPMETAAELAPDTAVLQYSVGEKEIWLLILTRDGVTAHKLGCETLALPELRSRQQATVAQLVEAWQKRPEKIGLDGLVHLARERAEDLARPERTIPTPALDDMVTRAKESTGEPTKRHNLVDAAQEQAILQRLGNNVLPTAALAELRQKKIHHLLVIPDGSLHYVPFAMLRIDGVMEKGSGGVLGQEGNGKGQSSSGKAHYLLEEFSVSYTPAMTTLETVRKQKKEHEAKRIMERRQLLAFANPAYGPEGVSTPPAKMTSDDMVTRLRSIRNDYYKGGGLRLTSLPETEKEAMRVASLFAAPKQCSDPTVVDTDASALVLTSKAASEYQAKRLLGPQSSALSSQPSARYRYLLFSTHGLADPQNGMLSCVALSTPATDSTEDGFLQAQEVLDLELDTDLVMLSACQTGLGRMRGGEGLVGLSGAFFVAGAESISASLWNVPSGPTGQLVTEFFKHLKEGKVDRAEALRQAQLTVMRSGQTADGKSADYSSPFCWAAFVLIGEHKQGASKD